MKIFMELKDGELSVFNQSGRGIPAVLTEEEKLNEITGKSIDYLLGVHTDEKEVG